MRIPTKKKLKWEKIESKTKKSFTKTMLTLEKQLTRCFFCFFFLFFSILTLYKLKGKENRIRHQRRRKKKQRMKWEKKKGGNLKTLSFATSSIYLHNKTFSQTSPRIRRTFSAFILFSSFSASLRPSILRFVLV